MKLPPTMQHNELYIFSKFQQLNDLILGAGTWLERQDKAAGTAVKEGRIGGIRLRRLQPFHEHAVHHGGGTVRTNVHHHLQHIPLSRDATKGSKF